MIQDLRKNPDPLQKLNDFSLAHRHSSLKILSTHYDRYENITSLTEVFIHLLIELAAAQDRHLC